jgi:hypothetical protein
LLAAVTATIFGMLMLVIAMLDDRAIHVTFDATRGGYIATHPQLAAPVTALSLSVLRARVGRQLDIAAVNVRLKLDRTARAQRDLRRRGARQTAKIKNS